MPAGRRPQSNAMLYTLVTFVGLFILAATVAVIYYVQFEEKSKEANELRNQRQDRETVDAKGKYSWSKKTARDISRQNGRVS